MVATDTVCVWGASGPPSDAQTVAVDESRCGEPLDGVASVATSPEELTSADSPTLPRASERERPAARDGNGLPAQHDLRPEPRADQGLLPHEVARRRDDVESRRLCCRVRWCGARRDQHLRALGVEPQDQGGVLRLRPRLPAGDVQRQRLRGGRPSARHLRPLRIQRDSDGVRADGQRQDALARERRRPDQHDGGAPLPEHRRERVRRAVPRLRLLRASLPREGVRPPPPLVDRQGAASAGEQEGGRLPGGRVEVRPLRIPPPVVLEVRRHRTSLHLAPGTTPARCRR